ncbi:MAG TPA: hypothetical protein VNA27_08760, partial [Rubrobacteraceae bacterium]|nr:hypothetical protein [Rubrobacteraceae bacterium]
RFGEDQEDYYKYLWDGFEKSYGDTEGWDAFEKRYEDGFEEQGFFAFADNRFLGDEARFFGDDRFEDDDDRDHWWDDDRNWQNDDRNDNDEVVPAVSQSFDQQAESGDVSQSFNVSNTGDNSNQCANVQGVANTGNAQNQIGVLQYGSEADDFSFEDSGSTINVSPNSATRCDQAVNQAATAYGR